MHQNRADHCHRLVHSLPHFHPLRCPTGHEAFQQKAELPDPKAACPEYSAVHSRVLQDVLLWVERTYQAFFRRVKNGETPGYPRFQGASRYRSFTYPQHVNGAVLDEGGAVLSLSKIGRVRVRMHRSLHGPPRPPPS
jgi:putative transposase